MRALIFALAGLLIAGCDQRKPKLTDMQIAAIKVDNPGFSNICLEKLMWVGFGGLTNPDECYPKAPPRRWRGLWRNDFESWRFCAEPARECSEKTAGPYVSLEMDPPPRGWRETPPGGLYAIEFIGRETIASRRFLGMETKDMVVDRLISIKQISPPPR